MKKLLLPITFLFCSTILKAGIDPSVGIDITPARYVFANQEEGLFRIDAICPDWNVPGEWPTKEVPYNDGLLAFSSNPSTSEKLAKYYGSGLSIVDLGGEVGKVLCLKGFDVSDEVFPYGAKPDNKDGIDQYSYFHLNFYSPIDPDKNLLTNKTFTIRIVSKIITTDPNDSKAIWDWQWRTPRTGELWTTSSIYSAMFEDEGEDSWCVTEMTCDPGDLTSGHFPITFKTVAAPELLLNSVLLIKELSFIADTKVTGASKKNPVITTEFINLEMDPFPTGIANNKVNRNCTVKNGEVTVSSMKNGEHIYVYSSSGMLIKKIVVANDTETFSIGKGFYTIKAGRDIHKVIN